MQICWQIVFLHALLRRIVAQTVQGQWQFAGDKEGEAAQNAVEEDDEDFDPEGGDKADDAEQVCILLQILSIVPTFLTIAVLPCITRSARRELLGSVQPH